MRILNVLQKMKWEDTRKGKERVSEKTKEMKEGKENSQKECKNINWMYQRCKI